jgi:nitroimidazol reductase NimA-like FMN-containing flavoprotein (pyridoxamine 5'-phosphate oxidase superfamily)
MQDMTVHEIDQMLSDARIGRLSMADATGRPYTIPLPFCWTDGRIYLRLPLTGRKGLVLTQNDQVCFEVDQFTETLDEYASVLIEGRLVPVTSADEKFRVKCCNDKKYNRLRRGYRPGHGRATPVDELPLRRIIVERIGGRKKDSAPEQAAELMIAAGI